ncbi:unknown [Ruminococcus sp. CAG:177]|nr:unknown [Ruminococcus sp. CAG:177]
MALKFAIQTALEFVAVILIIYGFWHEDKLIAFEDDLKAKFLNRKETKRNGKPDN